LNERLDGQGGHLMRLAIAIERLRSGYEASEIAPLLQNQGDYSYEKSLRFGGRAETVANHSNAKQSKR